jgi:hypothetical protein
LEEQWKAADGAPSVNGCKIENREAVVVRMHEVERPNRLRRMAAWEAKE